MKLHPVSHRKNCQGSLIEWNYEINISSDLKQDNHL